MGRACAEDRRERVQSNLGRQRHESGSQTILLHGGSAQAHPAFCPVGPSDRNANVRTIPLALTPGSEMIEEGVGIGVVTLPLIGNHRRERGKEDKCLKRFSLCGEIQVHGAAQLGRDHCIHLHRIFAEEYRIVDLACQVEDSMKPAVQQLGMLHGSLDIVETGNIRAQIFRLSTSFTPGSHTC
nr:hypothetical protein [uncultured bacterium]